MSPFSRYLKALRTRRGLRQKELAHQLGYEPSYISRPFASGRQALVAPRLCAGRYRRGAEATYLDRQVTASAKKPTSAMHRASRYSAEGIFWGESFMPTRQELDALWGQLERLLAGIIKNIEDQPEDGNVDERLVQLVDDIVDLMMRAFNAGAIGDLEEEERLLQEAISQILRRKADEEATAIGNAIGPRNEPQPEAPRRLFAERLRNITTKLRELQERRVMQMERHRAD